jgi:ubiquinone biosynthesis protein UbiJ
MATQSPFSFVEGLLQNFNLPFAPPAWAVEESHRRIVLLLNHVLVTPAGLLDVADGEAGADLTLVITQESPFAIAQTLMQGEKPPVRIEGDVQLAAEVNWLVDHVRWDMEEDLSRIMGDAPAHAMVETARTFAQALQQFVGKRAPGGDAGPSA